MNKLLLVLALLVVGANLFNYAVAQDVDDEAVYEEEVNPIAPTSAPSEEIIEEDDEEIEE